MKTLQLYAYSHLTRDLLLDSLSAAGQGDGCCIVGERAISRSTLEIEIEVQRASMADFYAEVVGTGMELTRESHLALTTLCPSPWHGRGDWTAVGLVSLKLTVCFLEGWMEDSFVLACSAPA